MIKKNPKFEVSKRVGERGNRLVEVGAKGNTFERRGEGIYRLVKFHTKFEAGKRRRKTINWLIKRV